MSLYVVYSGSNRSFGGGGGGGGSVNSVTASAPLASSGGANPNITTSLSNSTTDGYLSSVDWNTFNNKQPLLTPGSISTSTTGVTVGSGANSTVGPNVTINIQTASGSQPGLLSSVDWNTFNNKQNALTFGNLTDAGTDGIVITGGTGAVIGSGTSIAQHVADTTHNGYLSSTDWNTFNGKQSALTFVAPLVNTAGSVAINGSVADNKLNFASAADATKIVSFDLSSQTTATTLAITPTNTSSMVLNIPQVATAAGAGMALVQDETTGFIFGFGITSSIGAANSMFQLANATVANRAQIKLHSYFNGTSVAGVSTLTSRSGTIAVNAAVVAGQDYSKWTAQACATTAGSAPISGAWAFKANTVNSLTVTSDFHLQLTNLAGTLGDRLILGSEGALQLPHYGVGVLESDASGNISSVTPGNISTSTSGVTVGSGSASTVGPNVTIDVQTASGSQNGLLSSADWTTFNNKQPAGNYITDLTGEGTASGPGSAALTLSNAAVIGKLLTGFVSGPNSAVLATDSILIGIEKLQAQVSAASGSAITALTGDVTATGPGSVAATIAANAVTNSKLAQMPTLTLKGNNTGGTANALDLTVSQVQTMLSIPTSSSPLPLNAGGTGISAGSANAAFNALSPLTTKGDILSFSTVNARLGVGSDGQVLTADSTQTLGIKWATPSSSGVTTIGTFNSQASSANGLVISGVTLYAQIPTAANPGMVIIPTSASAISNTTGSIAVKVDASTIHINGSNNLSSLQDHQEQITLSGTDITNQYVDLAFPIFGSSASDNSASLFVVGGPMQQKTVDYTVSLTGGSGGVTRITFAGDLATGGPAALVATDILVIEYEYLA